MSRALRVGLATAIAVVAVIGGGYLYVRSRRLELPAPVRTVQSILELRAANSTDTTGYARYIESTRVASALAQDAAAAKGRSPIPEWETPTVVSSGETSASVLVRWKPTDRFEGWPEETTFVLRKSSGAWKVIDASEAVPSGDEPHEATATP